MRPSLASRLAVLALACAPASGAHAQSFLEGFARRAADRVAAAAEQRAAEAAERLVAGAAETDGGAEAATEEAPQPAPARGRRGARPAPAPIPTGPTPWPLNPLDANYTGDWEFDPAIEAQVEALHDFSAVDCMGCEGGYSYDSWITYHLENIDPNGGVPAMVGRLPVGGALEWTGIESRGRLEVVSEVPIGEFPCKQIRLTQYRGDRTFDAPGLYCYGKSHTYDRTGWIEVVG
jgi:hypothetical protein